MAAVMWEETDVFLGLKAVVVEWVSRGFREVATRFDLIDAHLTLGMLLSGPESYGDSDPLRQIEAALRPLEAAHATMTQAGH